MQWGRLFEVVAAKPKMPKYQKIQPKKLSILLVYADQLWYTADSWGSREFVKSELAQFIPKKYQGLLWRA